MNHDNDIRRITGNDRSDALLRHFSGLSTVTLLSEPAKQRFSWYVSISDLLHILISQSQTNDIQYTIKANILKKKEYIFCTWDDIVFLNSYYE